MRIHLNLIALRKAKNVYNFGISECNRIKPCAWAKGKDTDKTLQMHRLICVFSVCTWSHLIRDGGSVVDNMLDSEL